METSCAAATARFPVSSAAPWACTFTAPVSLLMGRFVTWTFSCPFVWFVRICPNNVPASESCVGCTACQNVPVTGVDGIEAIETGCVACQNVPVTGVDGIEAIETGCVACQKVPE